MIPARPSSADVRRGNAIFAPRPGTAPAKPKMRLISWRPLVKNSLRGFASVALPNGLTIHDIPVLVGKNGAWATLPSKPVLDQDGQHKTDPNGKKQYQPILEWRDRDLSKRFGAAIVALIQSAHPNDLGEPSAEPHATETRTTSTPRLRPSPHRQHSAGEGDRSPTLPTTPSRIFTNERGCRSPRDNPARRRGRHPPAGGRGSSAG